MKYLLTAYLFSAIGFFLVFLLLVRDVSRHFKKEDKRFVMPCRGYFLAFVYSLIPIWNSVIFYLTLKNYDLLLLQIINKFEG